MRRFIKVAVIAGTALIATGTAAHASVTVDAAGKGFVGKGDVQSALGYNNAALQKAVDAKSLVFTANQPTAQSLTQGVSQSSTQVGSQTGTQSATQFGTQSATQLVAQDLTCTFTNGNGTKTFHREGVRDGERTGTRQGSRIGTREGSRDGERVGTRTGIQTGSQIGSVAYDLDVDARKANQYTGFILKGWKGQPSYTATGAPTWNDPAFAAWSFGDWSFTGDYDFGAYQFDGAYQFGDYTFAPVATTAWGDWDAAGENPDDCLRSSNADKITEISNIVTPGVITPGAVTDGAIEDGAIENGAISEGDVTVGAIDSGAVVSGSVTPNGPATVFVNGKALTSTPAI